MGAPKTVIDYNEVLRLAHIHCTQEEIAYALDISLSVLQHDAMFSQVYKKGLEGGKQSLRRAQWGLALGREGVMLTNQDGTARLDDKGRPVWVVTPQIPNVTMGIWLGKQTLGQKDIVEHDVTDTLKDLVNELAVNRRKA